MTPADLHLRMADESDTEALVPLINRAFAIELKFFSTERIDLAETLEHMKKGVFLAAEDEAGIAGCVYVELRGSLSYFGLLAVDPDRQGRGLGRKLITAAEDYGRNARCGVMEIRILNHRTELPPLYEKLGYRFARIMHPPQMPSAHQPYHFIIMEKRLT